MRLKIRHKLFFTLLVTSVVVATGLFFYLQWSFDRGFFNYVKSQEKEQIDRLVTELTDSYAKHENWQFIVDNHRLWISLLGEIDPFSRRLKSGGPFPPIGERPPHAKAQSVHLDQPAPPPADPRILGPRVILFDSEKNRIMGGPIGEIETIYMAPLQYKGSVVGYIGLIPLLELSYAGDLLFVEEQKESFALVTLIMVIFSLLLAYPLTSHLLRPIKALTTGTNNLIGGLFQTRISVSSGDELGRLSEHFNILAMTLEKNEKARQQWVADISHELRTPLAVLRGEVEAMQDGVRKPEPKNIDGLHGEIMHLERIVGDLYELSMSDIGALNYKKIAINPVGILNGTLEMHGQRFVGKGIILTLADPSVDINCFMLGDPDRLQQLFTNLLENSLRYTDAPGGLAILVTVVQDVIRFSFQDSEPGVSEEHLPKLFDRLFRVDPSRSRSKGGVGLGLAICKNIVEAHQGSIKALHSPRGGLQVVIELPLLS